MVPRWVDTPPCKIRPKQPLKPHPNRIHSNQVVAVSCAVYAKHPHLLQLFVPHAAAGGVELPGTGARGRGCAGLCGDAAF